MARSSELGKIRPLGIQHAHGFEFKPSPYVGTHPPASGKLTSHREHPKRFCHGRSDAFWQQEVIQILGQLLSRAEIRLM